MKTNIFSDILKRLKNIQQILNLSNKEIKRLSRPERISRAQLKIGKQTYPAWRIVFNSTLGPGKGGIRFHPQASEDEVKSLAFWMMIKNSLANIPYGGAKGGVRFDPKKTSQKEIEKISRAFVNKFYKVLGADKDIPAPDVYTNSQVMAWMLDEYEKKIGHHEPGMITGKPLELGGCSLRGEATARGGFIIIQQLIKKFLKNKKKITFAVQGFGNAGANLAQMLYGQGYKVVAVSDSQSGIYNAQGLNIKQVVSVKQRTGSLVNTPHAQIISNQELLQLPVDVLVLAALENQITDKNVDKIKTKYIVELANGPITYQADQKLFNKKILVVPDVLANAGGVIVSYFEWVQNKTGHILDKNYLKKMLNKKMVESWQKVIHEFKTHNKTIDLRTAAYIIAVKKNLAAEKYRGNL